MSAKKIFSGRSIPPAWKKHAKKAIPPGANILGVGRKRASGFRLIKFKTKAGKVLRLALLEPVAHKAARMPEDVMERIAAKLPGNVNDVQVTRRGNKYRVIYSVNGKKRSVFVWERKEKNFKVFPVQSLKVTRITKASPKVRSRTVTKVIVE